MLPPARNKRTVSLTYTSNGQKTWAISAERIVDGAKGGNNFQGCQAREKYLLWAVLSVGKVVSGALLGAENDERYRLQFTFFLVIPT